MSIRIMTAAPMIRPNMHRRLSDPRLRFLADGGDGSALPDGQQPKGADDDNGDAGEADKGESKPTGDQRPDESLGDGGKKALDAERDARKAAEKANAELKAQLQKIEDAKLSDIDRATKDRQTAEAARDAAVTELAVYKLATKHGISDENDIAALKAIADEGTRETLAARLAPKPDDKKKGPDPVPKSGTGSDNGTSSSVSRGRELYEARKAKKK